MLAFDDTYFIALKEGNQTALKAWERIGSGEAGLISIISLYKLLRAGSPDDKVKKLYNTLIKLLRPVAVNLDVLDEAVELSRSFNLSVADALEVASLIDAGATEFYTCNKVFGKIHQKILKTTIIK